MFKICIIGEFFGCKYKAKDMSSCNQWLRLIAIFAIKNDKIQCIYTAILRNSKKIPIFFFSDSRNHK